MTTIAPPVEQRFLFDEANWAFYEEVLRNVGDRHVFVTYDRGRMEIMSPSYKHDKRARLIGVFLRILAAELEIELEGGGSTTFRRVDRRQGLEPDECFYVQNASRVVGKESIDLSSDPPPDLAIEEEISSRMVDRLPIYAGLGIPELWRDDGRTVSVYRLGTDGEYHPQEQSVCFPMLPMKELNRLLNMADGMGQTQWFLAARQWVSETLI